MKAIKKDQLKIGDMFYTDHLMFIFYYVFDIKEKIIYCKEIGINKYKNFDINGNVILLDDSEIKQFSEKIQLEQKQIMRTEKLKRINGEF